MKSHIFFSNIGIKTKLSFLSVALISITLILSLSISSYREIQIKRNEAKKLMVNIGKQIGLLKSLSKPLNKNIVSEYSEKTIYSSISRFGYSVSIVYIIVTDFQKQVETSSFNWNILKIAKQDPQVLSKKILDSILDTGKSLNPLTFRSMFGKNIQNLRIELGQKGNILIGFSLNILKGELIVGLLEHIIFGTILITIGIFCSIWIANKITRPIFTLINGFEKVAKGDFQTQIDLTTRDEFEQLSKSFNQMTRGLNERELIKDIFRRYATDQVVEKILKGEVRSTLSGELKDVTVLFADIRGFTSISSKLSPENIVYILNRFFTAMTEVVIQNEGLIDKFSGDEMMIVFGAPFSHPDDPQRAFKTALQMMTELKSVNEHLNKEGFPKIDIGIGINTGKVIAGNIGSLKRMAYTVIGQAVNIASRLESIANKGEICISQSTYKYLGDLCKAQPETITLKGLKEPLIIYRYILI